jgi:hypothetical protein
VANTPREECARRLGASHSKRMAASWSRSPADLTEYKVAVRSVAPERELPSDRDLKLHLMHVLPIAGGVVLNRPVTSALRVEANGSVRP